MPIRKLPPLLVNQIAAGEVIERPASVVKELVENSLDAGATRIDIAVEDGGHRLIRVSDDGKGIPPEELPLAVAPHATSKLEAVEGLEAIHTLGFRGEALASIASVSRLRLSTRHLLAPDRRAEAGASLESSGDVVGPVRPDACAGGSVIEVRDLFFNTPARRKFLRSASTEFGHISELISRMALVHHHVGFRLSHNGRSVLDLPPESARDRRVIAVLGKDLEEGLLAFEHEVFPGVPAGAGVAGAESPRPPGVGAGEGGLRVWGMAGVPSLARATAKFQYLCVNGRPIRDRNLSHAIREAYRGLIPPDKQPMVVIFLELDPRAVDVNVHPTKAEVRFRNPSAVHGLVLSALRQRLLGADLTPTVGVPSPESRVSNWFGTPDSGGNSGSGGRDTEPTVNDFVDYFRKMEPTQKTFAFDEVRRAMAEEHPLHAELNGHAEPAAGSQPPPPAIAPTSILQVHKSYVVTQDDDGLVIVDQHALHERVMFEELRRRVLGAPAPGVPGNTGGDGGDPRPLESQRLLMPVVVDADARAQAVLEELQPLLQRIGIEAEPIGPGAVGIQAFPTFLFDRHVEPAEFVRELLEKAEAGELRAGGATNEEAALHEVLDMMACKAAVKAGDKLTEGELAALLAKRAEIERSSNCPHGRPTTLRLSLKDLERQFGRT